MSILSSELSEQAIAAIHRLEPETLLTGDQGGAVKELQLALTELNFFNGAVDGIYGLKTANGIRRVQRRLGLEETGVFDQNTWYGMTYWSNDLSIDHTPNSSKSTWSPLKQAAKFFGI